MSLKGKSNAKRPKKAGTRTYANKKFNRNSLLQLNLSDLYDRFMAEKRTAGLSRITLRDYDTHYGYLQDFLYETQGVKDLLHAEIISDVFTDYMTWMQARNLKPTTINVRVRTIRAFLRWCYLEEYIDEPIFRKFKPMKAAEEQVEAFTAEEVRRILSVIDTDTFVGFRDYLIILIIMDTLARAREIVNIQRSNIDLKAQEIGLEADGTKAKKARTLPLSNRTARMLTEYMAESEEFEEETLFVTYDGRPLNDGTLRKNLSEYGKLVGIDNKRVSPHTFRHTGALFYVMNGGDPFSLMKILGHSDLSMVRKYVNMANGDIRRQHDHFSPVKSLFK